MARRPGKVVAAVAFGRFPLTPHEPEPDDRDVRPEEQRTDHRDGSRQRHLDRVHVVPGDRPRRHDPVMPAVNALVEPRPVQRAVREVIEEVVEVEEERELGRDHPPGRERARVHAREPQERPRGDRPDHHPRVVDRPALDRLADQLLLPRRPRLNAIGPRPFRIARREHRERHRKQHERRGRQHHGGDREQPKQRLAIPAEHRVQHQGVRRSYRQPGAASNPRAREERTLTVRARRPGPATMQRCRGARSP